MKTIYEKLQTVRVALQKKNLKKSGKNKHQNFDYFQLDDFLPAINELMLEHKLASQFTLTTDKATLTINDYENEKSLVFEVPATMSTNNHNPVQNIGSTITYFRRYLNVIAFEICEPDELDGVDLDKLKDKPISATALGLGYAIDVIDNAKTIEQLEATRSQLLVKKWSVADAAALKLTIENKRKLLIKGGHYVPETKS
jgi:hypothetical protein